MFCLPNVKKIFFYQKIDVLLLEGQKVIKYYFLIREQKFTNVLTIS